MQEENNKQMKEKKSFLAKVLNKIDKKMKAESSKTCCACECQTKNKE